MSSWPGLSRSMASCIHKRRKTWLPGAGPGMTLESVMSASVSPHAPKHVPDMPAVAGVRLATAQAGIRYKGRTDVLLALFDEGTTAAGVFTRSKCPSAPVEWCRANLEGGKSAKNSARALVVNS